MKMMDMELRLNSITEIFFDDKFGQRWELRERKNKRAICMIII